jgi:FAD/FMN-containing dehydrogenase
MIPFAKQKLSGWGGFPREECAVFRPEKRRTVSEIVSSAECPNYIARGLGRSYGDAAVNTGGGVVSFVRLNRMLAFDGEAGVLDAESGVSLAEIIEAFLPRGWFLPVTPGTKFVTLGGAIAHDVHGKNHHRDGSFGGFVERLTLRVADGREVTCGPTRERELFLATVGGMGLTGLIVEVAFRLRRVESPWIALETQGARGLDEMLDGLRDSATDWPYTVGWIDGLARGATLGGGVLMRGRHASREEVGARRPPPARRLRVPLDAPGWLLNPAGMRLFNRLYRWRHGRAPARRLVWYEDFFYPLDAILDWNRLYGKRGFLQYQCVVPQAAGRAPVARVLERAAASGAASFLAVLKDCGPASPAYLSFPMPGTTLALDFPYRGPATETLVHELNAVVRDAGGRVYLAKDAVTRAEDFARMMPRLDQWRAVRDRWDPARRFRSAQSVRLLGDPA